MIAVNKIKMYTNIAFENVNKHSAQLNIPKAFAKYEFQEELKSLPTLYESNLLL